MTSGLRTRFLMPVQEMRNAEIIVNISTAVISWSVSGDRLLSSIDVKDLKEFRTFLTVKLGLSMQLREKYYWREHEGDVS